MVICGTLRKMKAWQLHDTEFLKSSKEWRDAIWTSEWKEMESRVNVSRPSNRRIQGVTDKLLSFLSGDRCMTLDNMLSLNTKSHVFGLPESVDTYVFQ